MPLLKRKALTPPPLVDPVDSDTPLDLDTAADEPQRKRTHLDSLLAESALRRLPRTLLEQHLPSQKRRCLSTLVGDLPHAAATSGDATAARGCVGLDEEYAALHSMLRATVTTQESNSCLLIGAAGAGKSLLVDSVLRSLGATPFYRVHLAASVQINDRAAMKEMAQQLILQGAFSEDDVTDAMDDSEDVDDPEDPEGQQAARGGGDHVFGGEGESDDEVVEVDQEAEMQDELAGAILSSLNNTIAHIIALLSTTSGTQGGRKPLVITLDDFDLFTARPRQALLYCLLDAVQAASYGAGLAVVGLTSRVDTVDLLEKRVKSRFSHRILHVRPAASYEVFESVVRSALQPVTGCGEFDEAWAGDVGRVVAHSHVRDVLRGIYELSNDVRMIYRILLPAVSRLSVEDPVVDVARIVETASVEVGDGIMAILRDLTESELALLIAVKQLQLRDRGVFNFEMLFDELRRFAARDARERQAASTTTTTTTADSSGGLVGSALSIPLYADRKIALLAFHSLLSLELLLPENYVATLTISNPVAKPSATPTAAQTGKSNQNTIRKEFWKVRSSLLPHTILAAVKDRSRPIPLTSSLVKWASSNG